MAKFKARYEIADGYVGKSRPQYVSIDSSEVTDDMDEKELRCIYQETIEEDYRNNHWPEGENEDEFVEWAKEQQGKKLLPS